MDAPIKNTIGANNIKSSTCFSTLPIPLQEDILGLLTTNKDIKSIRSVSPQWYRMVNQVHPPRFRLCDNNDLMLEMLKNSFYQRISSLHVSNYQQTLPIYTATRFNIPKTNRLELCEGISTENIMKLIRYYAKSCNTLILWYNSFENVPSYRLKGCLTYENLRCLEISFHISQWVGLRDYHLKERNHVIALAQFVGSVMLINLQEFRIYSPKTSQDWSAEDLVLYTKFSKTMNVFLEKHGPQLTKLLYYAMPLAVIESFTHLCSLETLEVCFNCRTLNGELITIDDINPALFSGLKKLKSLELCIDLDEVTNLIHYQIISNMLHEYRNSIRKFYLSTSHFTLHWIPTTCSLQLEGLCFRFDEVGDSDEFNLMVMSNPHPKFETVSKLNFEIRLGIIDGWTTIVFDWIITNFPNLKNLNLVITRVLNLQDLHLLIGSLNILTKLSISFFRFCLPAQTGKDLLTEEAKNWFVQNNGNGFIKVLSIGKYLKVLIKRPILNTIFD